jgi:hypothetical protein
MPRKKRAHVGTSAVAEVSPHEAHILLRKLQEIGHVTAGHFRDARHALAREVEEIVARLAQLKGTAHAPVSSRKAAKSAVAAKAKPARPAAKRPRKQAKVPVSPERRKIMQLQGRYMALGHRIPKTEMNKFREMIKTKGKEATIKAMAAYVTTKR